MTWQSFTVAFVCMAGITVALAWGKTRQLSGGGISVDSHQATTAHAQCLYPFQASAGLNTPGVYVGRTTPGSAPFCYDGWELYHDDVITNTNIVLVGQIGRGKSALAKSLLWRNAGFGRRSVVIDPKGEYGPLVAALGGTIIALEPGGPNRVNPLDSDDEDQVAEILFGLVAAALHRDLTAEERAGLIVGYRHAALRAETEERRPTLPDVAEAMFLPTKAQATELHTEREQLAAATRHAALALWELCEGHLKGMFDGPTNVEVDWDAPIIVIDISALGVNSSALGVVMAAAIAWIHPILAREEAGQRFLLLDEAWYLLTELALARWLQSMFKLSRQYGLTNVIVVHRLSDLQAAGAETFKIAQGLLSDAETKIVYAQPDGEIANTRALLGLNRTEADRLVGLPKGVALWKVATHSFLVAHQLTAYEVRYITDTDASMHHTSESPAVTVTPVVLKEVPVG